MALANGLLLLSLLCATISSIRSQNLSQNEEVSTVNKSENSVLIDNKTNCYGQTLKCTPQVFVQNCFSHVAAAKIIVIPEDFTVFLTDEKDVYLQEAYGDTYFRFNSTGPSEEFSKNGTFTCGPRMEELQFYLQVPIQEPASDYADSPDSPIDMADRSPDYYIPIRTEKTNYKLGIYRALEFTANGYIKGYNESNHFSFYIPPELYCVSGFGEKWINGKFCMPKTNKDYPTVRRCIKPFELRKLQTNLLPDLELNITHHYEQDPKDLFYDTRFLEKHLKMRNPIFLQRRLTCDEKITYVSDPTVDSSISYHDFSFLPDGQLIGRDSGSVPWKPITDVVGGTDEYCIDTFQTESDTVNPTTPHRRRIVIYCADTNTTYDSDLSDTKQLYVEIQKYLLIFSDVVLSAIILVYIIIWREQNVHGRTTAVFVFCMFIYFLMLTFSLFETFPYGSQTCTANAVIYHFAVLSMYSWMAIMNFDIWSTINSMVAASQRTKGNKRFALYCLIGFGCPLIVVCISLGLHYSYPIDTEGIILPNYGYLYCVIRQGVYAYYQLTPLGISFIVSVVFGVLTMHTLLKWSRDSERIKSSSTKAARNQCILILKLFVLMGTTWGLEIILLLVYREQRAELPAFLVACYHCLVTGIFFWIFVIKREVADHLFKTIPALRSVSSWVAEKYSVQSSGFMHSTVTTKSFRSKATDVEASFSSVVA